MFYQYSVTRVSAKRKTQLLEDPVRGTQYVNKV